eukprot:4552069-Pleurochrysis_carterae.AAC.2
MDDMSSFFEQMALVLYLQRFTVPLPDAEAAARKWKPDAHGQPPRAEVCSVASLSVIIPWNRFCQVSFGTRAGPALLRMQFAPASPGEDGNDGPIDCTIQEYVGVFSYLSFRALPPPFFYPDLGYMARES